MIISHRRAGQCVFRKEITSCGFKLLVEPVLPELYENYIMVFAPTDVNLSAPGSGWATSSSSSSLASLTSTRGHLPAGFVYLDQVDSSIQVSLRYQTTENFMGERIDGYVHEGDASCTVNFNRVVITQAAALALKAVQQDVLKDGYCLVVYDAFRPQRAVDHFYRWSQAAVDGDGPPSKEKQFYYPHIDKKDLFDRGYIAQRSGHSRGSTVDLTLISVGKTVSHTPTYIMRGFPHNDGGGGMVRLPYADDNTVDMGASFDLLDEASHGDYPHIPPQQQQMRAYLDAKMSAHGFQGYDQEWWHFTLLNEPFPDTYHDFSVV